MLTQNQQHDKYPGLISFLYVGLVYKNVLTFYRLREGILWTIVQKCSVIISIKEIAYRRKIQCREGLKGRVLAI